jgi:hypothetical protein
MSRVVMVAQASASATKSREAPQLPGCSCYTELSLGSRATLRLEPGTYSFRSASVEPSAIVITSPGAKLDIRDAFTFRGLLKAPDGSQGYLPLKFRGNGNVILEAPIYSSVVAPLGTLVLGGTTGQIFRGQYFAKHIEVRSGVQIVASNQAPPGFVLQSHQGHDVDLELAEEDESQQAAGCSMRPWPARSGGSLPWALTVFVGWSVFRRRSAITSARSSNGHS